MQSTDQFYINCLLCTRQMLVFIFIVLCTTLDVPLEIDSYVQRHAWARSSEHETSPCVAVDAYVRPYGQTLIVSVIGLCDGMKLASTWCDIRSSTRQSKRLQKAVEIKTAPQGDIRGGGKSSSSPLVLGGHKQANQQQQQPVRTWNQFAVDCGPVTQKGHVSIRYGTETLLANISFSMPVVSTNLKGAGVCSRLFDNRGWTDANSVLVLEWLEWQFAIGFDVVHLYVNSLSIPELWQSLSAYAKAGLVVLHAWSDSTDDDDSVEHSPDLALGAYLTDCFLRLEGTVQYMTALETDDFLQTTDITETLNIHYLSKNVQTNVVVIEPQTVIPEQCDPDDGSERSSLYVTGFCKGHDSSYQRVKYFIRSNKDRPFALFPTAHAASDGRPSSRMPKQSLGLLHLGRFKGFNPSSGKKIQVLWNNEVSRSVAKSILARELVGNLYSTFKTAIGGSTDEASGVCLKFLDGGADVGDSLLKFAYPDRYPRSGLASVAKSLDLKKYQCRHFLAFEGDSTKIDKLRANCLELAKSNCICTPVEGILSHESGSVEFYVDTKTAANQLASSVFSRSGASIVDVDAFDIVAVLRSFVVRADYVVVKLDIEGSEYDVLQSLVANDNQLCRLIDVLLIEWHASKLVGAAAGARKDLQEKYDAPLELQQTNLLAAFKDCGVDVRAQPGVTD